MKPQFPTVQEQINYWNKLERLEHERVMNIRAESPNESTQTGVGITTFDQLSNGELFEFYKKTDIGHGLYNGVFTKTAYDTYRGQCGFVGFPQPYAMVRRITPDDASNPQEQASTTALALDQTEATTDWFDGLADTPYHLRDEGTVDGEGESYAARNL